MKRYIYILSRRVTVKNDTVFVPNLGVHTSKASALKHFHMVRDDRLQNGSKLQWEHGPIRTFNWSTPRDGSTSPAPDEIREACFVHPDGSREELTLETWTTLRLGRSTTVPVLDARRVNR